MPKQKSSASAGTRKKHAKKAAGKDGVDEQPQKPQKLQRGQKKLSKAQQRALPKVKRYIPPPKPPAPPIPDPLDGQGLAKVLPAELVVVLRRLGKKDDVTRRKGLEDFREYIGTVREKEDWEIQGTLGAAVPVWMHNLASLLQSPSHRSATLQLHADLLSIPSVRTLIIDTLSLSLLPGDQHRDTLGSWLVAALEEGRRSGGIGMKSWEEATKGGIDLDEQKTIIIEYLSLAILDPPSLHDSIHPLSTETGEAAVTEEKWARYRVGGLVGLAWILQQPLTPELSALIHNPALWTCLSSSEAAFGQNQPPVRRAAYTVLGTLLDHYPDEIAKEDMLETLTSEMLEVVWLEKEGIVWETAGPVVVKILSKHRDMWAAVDDTTFDRLLDFIATICPSIPQRTYPLLLVILSTLPESFLALEDPSIQLENFFAHLWSPVDAKLLSTHALPGQPSVFQAFVRDAVDCISYLVGKANRAEEEETVEWLVDQLGDRVWQEGVLVGRKRGPETEASAFGQAMGRLGPEQAERLLVNIRESTIACDTVLIPRIPPIFAAVKASVPEPIRNRLDEILLEIGQIYVERLDQDPVYADALVQLIDIISEDIISQVIERFPQIVTLPPSTFIPLAKALSTRNKQVPSALSSLLPALDQDSRFAIIQLAPDLITSDILDSTGEEAVHAALNDTKHVPIAASCINSLSPESLHIVLALVCTDIVNSTNSILTTSEKPVPNAAIEILGAYEKIGELVQSDAFSPALVSLHHIVILLPRLHESHHVTPAAQALWERTPDISGKVRDDLASLIQDTSCRVEPSVLVDVALLTTSTPTSLLPESLQRLVADYAAAPAAPSLTVTDPLIPFETDEASPSVFDLHGRSRAARLAEAALAIIRTDRHLATDPGLLETVLSARILAMDAIAVPGGSRGFLDSATPTEVLDQMIREAEGALSFAIADFDEVDLEWHRQAAGFNKGDTLQQLLANLANRINGASDDVLARTLRDVLGRQLRQSGAGEKEAEIWLASALKSNPSLAAAIIYAIKPFMLDSKALAAAQNRLASSLSGVPASRANEQGLPALRLLIASAPPADAASVFIPQQRAMFVLRHLASWLTSDEDFDEEIDYRVAQLYTALSPVVQDLQGAHWDGIFDLIETGLEATLDDPRSSCLVYQCLLLLQQVRDLCETNKALRASWTGKSRHFSLVFQLFLQCRNADTVPIRMIQNLLLDLLRDSEGEDETRLVDLLSSSSSAVQTAAYRLIKSAIKRDTLALVLEVETAIQDTPREIQLPPALITLAGKEIDNTIETVLARLLSWMAILDHFEDASRTIRWAYLDQLNTSNLLPDNLLPLLFTILGVSEVGAWNFGASSYAVDEFYPDLLEPEELADLAPLASHIYYRTLVIIPSAIRGYYEGLKDRQLSMSMLNFTARHYSPVIIQNEFAALREPSAMAQLTEEGLNIKIASGGGATIAGGGSAEAIASYVVDEQPMEIGIRLPTEFPLKGVDVRDLRRVGVPENKWRGWLMSVQQTITSRNGLILEALTLFKKNVSLHFEGVVECAICYSIISLTDRTLPTKPCKTCKNRFHASCLYKWFNSSHSSSCPLCRALF